MPIQKWLDVKVVNSATSSATIEHLCLIFSVHGSPETIVTDSVYFENFTIKAQRYSPYLNRGPLPPCVKWIGRATSEDIQGASEENLQEESALTNNGLPMDGYFRDSRYQLDKYYGLAAIASCGNLVCANWLAPESGARTGAV